MKSIRSSSVVIFLPTTNEVWGKVMFFTGVCLSTERRGGWLPRMHHRLHDHGRELFIQWEGFASRVKGVLHPGEGSLHPGGGVFIQGVGGQHPGGGGLHPRGGGLHPGGVFIQGGGGLRGGLHPEGRGLHPGGGRSAYRGVGQTSFPPGLGK